MLLEESLAKRERAEPSWLLTLHQGSLDDLTTLVNSIFSFASERQQFRWNWGGPFVSGGEDAK
jgi:hypothetical protein